MTTARSRSPERASETVSLSRLALAGAVVGIRLGSHDLVAVRLDSAGDLAAAVVDTAPRHDGWRLGAVDAGESD